MIDHFNLPVSDLGRSRSFYERVLRPLGFVFVMEDGAAIGFGRDSWEFGVVATAMPIQRLHLAFTAPSREAVDQFFSTAVAAGAACNGAPGLRPEYSATYYAAFIIDPDGHNVEAVHRG
jgi:predicted lactoylglutathione lyase